MPGLSLHDHVIEEGPLAGREPALVRRSAWPKGIASVHAVGVLHRDVKPSNVLMEGRTPILIDFGLARVADDPKLTLTGWLMGTPGYLAPEILHGDDATPACDVHSWASTVAYAGLGRSPFGRGPSMAVMDRVRRGEHDLTGLPDELASILAAALDPDPMRRPGLDHVVELVRGGTDLTPALGAGRRLRSPHPATAPGEEPPAPTRFLRSRRRRRRTVDGSTTSRWRASRGTTSPGPDRPRVSAAERLRRGLLPLARRGLAGAGIAAYPWLALAALVVLTWLLRSGSLAAARTVIGGAIAGASGTTASGCWSARPWDLVRSVPSTLVLLLWSVGLAIAAALVCYAVAAGVTISLFASGVVFAASLGAGPGGDRVRSPLGRVVRPLSADARRWVVALVVVMAAGVGLGLRADLAGPNWAPDRQAPWVGISLPDAPLGL